MGDERRRAWPPLPLLAAAGRHACPRMGDGRRRAWSPRAAVGPRQVPPLRHAPPPGTGAVEGRGGVLEQPPHGAPRAQRRRQQAPGTRRDGATRPWSRQSEASVLQRGARRPWSTRGEAAAGAPVGSRRGRGVTASAGSQRPLLAARCGRAPARGGDGGGRMQRRQGGSGGGVRQRRQG